MRVIFSLSRGNSWLPEDPLYSTHCELHSTGLTRIWASLFCPWKPVLSSRKEREMIEAFVSCRSWSKTCLFLIQERDSFNNIHSFYQWLDLKKKVFITPPVAAGQIIFAGVHRSGSNCYSTTTVDRVALILGCPFPTKGDEFIIFSWVVHNPLFLDCILVTPERTVLACALQERGSRCRRLPTKSGINLLFSNRFKPFIRREKESALS